MKMRAGFVSNSSTASFVLLGFDATGLVDPDTDGGERKLLEMNCDYLGSWDLEYIVDGVDVVVGEYISYVHSDSPGQNRYSAVKLDEINEKVEGYKKQLGAKTEVKLWSGIIPA